MKEQLKLLGELDALVKEHGGEEVFRIEMYANGSGYIVYTCTDRDWGFNDENEIASTINGIKEEIKDGSFFE